MSIIKNLSVYFLLFFLVSCRSIEDYQLEGASVADSLTQDLKSIHNRQELVEAGPKLQAKFEKLVDIIIEAREFERKNPKWEVAEISLKSHQASEALKVEITRIYSIEGGRALLEKYEESALHRLDAYEKRYVIYTQVNSKIGY